MTEEIKRSGPSTEATYDGARRLHCESLSEVELTLLRLLHRREQDRRSSYDGGPLRLCIDGREFFRCYVTEGLFTCFRVPLESEYIEVFGDDDEGEFLLGVFTIAELDVSADDENVVAGEEIGKQRLSTYVIGKAIELSVYSVRESRSAAGYLVEVRYRENTDSKTSSLTVGSEISDAPKLYSLLIGAIAKRLSDEQFNTWFHEVSYSAIGDSTIYLNAPNSAVRDWITLNYDDVIGSSLNDIELYGYTVKVLDSSCNRGKFEGELSAKPGDLRPIGTKSSNNLETKAHVVNKTDPGANLNVKYSYDSFVVGSCNQFAHAASIAVAEAPGRTYNPLYIYAGVGLGKTHLIHACGHAIRTRNKHLKVCYISSERFMNDLINAIRYDKTQIFREKYRSLDVLLVDDVQFLAGKERTQEEFFHTFNSLYDQHKQIIITSDCLPREIPTLEERLNSRFEWGLIADIEPPDLETKIAILKRKGDQAEVSIPDDVAMFIASRVKSNVRELEGSLIRLIAISSLRGVPINMVLAQEAIRSIVDYDPKLITISAVQNAVALQYRLTVQDLISKSASKRLTIPRQIAMYISRQVTNSSYPEIARAFGHRHHTSVIHAVKGIAESISKDRSLEGLINTLISDIKNARNEEQVSRIA